MINPNYINVVYSTSKKPFTSYPEKLIKYLTNKFNLKTESKILEIGCGRGEFLNQFTKLGMYGYGVDITNYAVSICKNAEIKLADIAKDNIPYHDNFFDIVFTKSFIEHFYNTEHVFKEAYRVLKPGGVLINLTPEWRYIYRSFYDDYTHRTPFTKKSLEDIHAVTNFKDVTVLSFRQLPITWSKNFFIRNIFTFLGEITRIFVPDYFRMKNKWVRFSKEIMLLSCGIK